MPTLLLVLTLTYSWLDSFSAGDPSFEGIEETEPRFCTDTLSPLEYCEPTLLPAKDLFVFKALSLLLSFFAFSAFSLSLPFYLFGRNFLRNASYFCCSYLIVSTSSLHMIRRFDGLKIFLSITRSVYQLSMRSLSFLNLAVLGDMPLMCLNYCLRS